MSMGKAFAFYAKYPQEMDACANEEINFLDMLDDDEVNQINNLIECIDQWAGSSCKKMLSKCMEEISDNYNCRVIPVSCRSPWETKARLCKKAGKKPNKFSMTCGIYIDTSDERNILFANCWFWIKGRSVSSEEAACELQSRLESSGINTEAFTYELGGVTAYIHRYGIIVPDSGIIEEDFLIGELTQKFIKFGAKNVNFLLNYLA